MRCSWKATFACGTRTCRSVAQHGPPWHCKYALDRNVGSLTFFKNGAQFGTGFPEGSIVGRVHMGGHMRVGQVLRLIENPDWPKGCG